MADQQAAPSNAKKRQEPTVEAVGVSARLLHFVGEGLRQQGQDAAAWWLVSRLPTVLACDRVVLFEVGRKLRLVTSDAGVENIADSELVDIVSATFKKSPVERLTVWGCHDSNNPLPKDFTEAQGGSSVVVVSCKAGGKSWALWVERWRGRYWSDAERALLERFPEYVGAILNVSPAASSRGSVGRWLMLALLLFLLFPIRDDVAADVSIVPNEPRTVFAQLDAPVADVYVTNGQKVGLGEKLFGIDDELLRKELHEARGELRVALAEKERLEAAAYQSADARSQLKVQDVQVELAVLRVDFLQLELEKALAVAPSAGVVDFIESDSLLGAYLRKGEKVLRVIDENSLRAELFVPVADAGRFEVGSEVGLRLDSKPFEVVSAKVESIGFDVVVSSSDVPSIKAVARINGKQEFVRAGAQGSANVRTGWTVMAVRLLRKPFAYLAGIVGF